MKVCLFLFFKIKSWNKIEFCWFLVEMTQHKKGRETNKMRKHVCYFSTAKVTCVLPLEVSQGTGVHKFCKQCWDLVAHIVAAFLGKGGNIHMVILDFQCAGVVISASLLEVIILNIFFNYDDCLFRFFLNILLNKQ